MKNNAIVVGRFAVLVLMPFVAGCASVSVKEDRWSNEKFAAPARVYVAEYAAPDEVLRVDREGPELREFREGLSRNFAAALRQRISEQIAPAREFAPGVKPERGSWVVEGEFLRVNQGSRLLRSLIGFGSGGTKLETRTRIAEVLRGGRRRDLGVIETTGGSNAEPGALAGPPLTGGLRLVLSATLTGLSPDLRRTARMITAAMAEKLRSQGHALVGESEPVKRLGSRPEDRSASTLARPAPARSD